MMTEPNWHELQYNPRTTVANASEIIPAWKIRAEQTRERFKFDADVSYGPHPREVFDFYRAPNSKGTVIYIHGGYWRMLSKVETSWVADGFMEQGVSVALINYPLCPEVSLGDIRDSIIRAFVYLYRNALNDDERANIVVAGHSAGGHLAALHLATDWASHGLPENPIAGVIAISGIYDVAPLMQTSMNADIQITGESAPVLNLMASEIKSRTSIVFAVGGDEPSEFHRQAADQAKAWALLNPKIISLPQTNHFTVVDSLAKPGSEINRIALAMLSRQF
jgi:arylformamidase